MRPAVRVLSQAEAPRESFRGVRVHGISWESEQKRLFLFIHYALDRFGPDEASDGHDSVRLAEARLVFDPALDAIVMMDWAHRLRGATIEEVRLTGSEAMPDGKLFSRFEIEFSEPDAVFSVLSPGYSVHLLGEPLVVGRTDCMTSPCAVDEHHSYRTLTQADVGSGIFHDCLVTGLYWDQERGEFSLGLHYILQWFPPNETSKGAYRWLMAAARVVFEEPSQVWVSVDWWRDRLDAQLFSLEAIETWRTPSGATESLFAIDFSEPKAFASVASPRFRVVLLREPVMWDDHDLDFDTLLGDTDGGPTARDETLLCREGSTLSPFCVFRLLVAFFDFVAREDFAGLGADPRFNGASEAWIRRVIGEYQVGLHAARPTMPPLSALWCPSDVVPLDTSICGREGWAVDVDFFFDDVRSDLALACTAVRDGKGNWILEIDEIHVP